MIDRREALRRLTYISSGVVSMPILAGILNSCAKQDQAAFEAQAFTPIQAGVLAALSEVILPETDIPGAKTAEVPQFIDRVVSLCFEETERERFKEGLDKVEENSQQVYGKSFIALDPNIQLEIAEKLDREANEAKKASVKPLPFFIQLKELTILGYFTSEAGATQALSYIPVPGRYEGCLPLQAGQKAWAV